MPSCKTCLESKQINRSQYLKNRVEGLELSRMPVIELPSYDESHEIRKLFSVTIERTLFFCRNLFNKAFAKS